MVKGISFFPQESLKVDPAKGQGQVHLSHVLTPLFFFLVYLICNAMVGFIGSILQGQRVAHCSLNLCINSSNKNVCISPGSPSQSLQRKARLQITIILASKDTLNDVCPGGQAQWVFVASVSRGQWLFWIWGLVLGTFSIAISQSGKYNNLHHHFQSWEEIVFNKRCLIL